MNLEELQTKLEAQDQLLLKIYSSVEKTRKYFMWTLIISIVTVVLPVIGLLFAVPWIINMYSLMYSGF